MSKYYEWGVFKNIYLEDSFVLRIDESEEEISFTVDAVLTEKHPKHAPPSQYEQYCYKKARIVFKGLKSVRWLEKNSMLFTDADGSEDYGNIDSFELSSEGYRLLGDWGEAIICSDPPDFELT
ncbi:hypothetical protein ABC502_00640 [Alkalimonas sp. NCh-2]|uniref:hypothetical protein n=1 Tax=Alkalimonas sp. NCh-2 TaxID=3144846 RepID=UPI0031F6619A